MKVVFLFLVLLLQGCDRRGSLPEEKLKVLVNQELDPGDGDNRIVAFMEHQEWLYSYDRIAQRYQATDPRNDSNEDLQYVVLIYVDDSKRFLRVEVEVDRRAVVW